MYYDLDLSLINLTYLLTYYIWSIFQTLIRSGVYYRGRSNIDILNHDQILSILQRRSNIDILNLDQILSILHRRSNIDISNLDQIWNILQRQIKCRSLKIKCRSLKNLEQIWNILQRKIKYRYFKP